MSDNKYYDLLDASKNTNAIQDDTEKLVESRYSVAIASAKRARQLIDGAEPLLPNEDGRKPLVVAIEELAKNVVTIKRGSEVDDDPEIAAAERREIFDFGDSEEAYEDGDEESEDDGNGEDGEAEDDTMDTSSEDDYNSDSEA